MALGVAACGGEGNGGTCGEEEKDAQQKHGRDHGHDRGRFHPASPGATGKQHGRKLLWALQWQSQQARLVEEDTLPA